MAVGIKNITSLEKIPGIRLGSAASGIRYKNRNDLLVILADEGSRFAGVFTTNKFSAAPVIISRRHMKSTKPRACLVNSGNANAGTGKIGEQDAITSCRTLSEFLGLKPEAVLPFSTGVIGEYLPIEKITAAIPLCIKNLDEDNWVDAAHTIMTTDTVAKGNSHKIHLDGQAVTITGITKGSGMICPNMATLLSYVATDARVDNIILQQMLEEIVTESFNKITVDGDTSTNDACMLIATGKAQHREINSRNDANYQLLYEALKKVFISLAHAVIRDAEGASKFVTVSVINAATEEDALAAAMTVAHSPLVKTALAASDPNWGRILAAVGRANLSSLDINKVGLSINTIPVLLCGEKSSKYTEEQGKKAMSEEEIVIEIDLGLGHCGTQIWTCDLTQEYIRINASYRS